MNYYVIASGGSGNQCLSSLIFMVAARFANPKVVFPGKIFLRLIDMDKKSASKQECLNLIKLYNAYRKHANRGANGGMNMPEIVLESWDFTDAVYYRAGQNGTVIPANQPLSLSQMFLSTLDEHTRLLLRSFYSEAELRENLDKGFYGHPNIGSEIFNYVRDDFLAETMYCRDEATGNFVPADSEFMKQLKDDLRHAAADVKVPLYLYGSMFGGTGASVIPNLVDVLRSIPAVGVATAGGVVPEPWGVTRLRIGAAMLLPYFNLPPQVDENGQPIDTNNGHLTPNDNKFVYQTIEALKYYDDSALLTKLDSLLLLGQNERTPISEEYSIGGETQISHYHIVQLMAAAAGLRFLHDDLLPLGLLQWQLRPETTTSNDYYNSMLPSELGLPTEEGYLQDMVRFCLMVCYYIKPHFLDRDDGQSLVDHMRGMQEVVLTCRTEYNNSSLDHNETNNPLPTTSGFLGFGRKVKNLTQTQANQFYQEPINTALSFCEKFLTFFYDCAASGHNWSSSDPMMSGRFIDMVNPRNIPFEQTDTDKILNTTLDTYFRYICLDEDRSAGVVHTNQLMRELYDTSFHALVARHNHNDDFCLSDIFLACYNAAAENN